MSTTTYLLPSNLPTLTTTFNVENYNFQDEYISLKDSLNVTKPVIYSNSVKTTGVFNPSKIVESISAPTTYTYSSNILTYDYTNGAIVNMTTLASSTNFALYLTNVNISALLYKTFTVTLLIDPTTYKAFANTCRINGTPYTLQVSGGLINVNLSQISTTGLITQTISVIYTTSGTVPYRVISNIGGYF